MNFLHLIYQINVRFKDCSFFFCVDSRSSNRVGSRNIVILHRTFFTEIFLLVLHKNHWQKKIFYLFLLWLLVTFYYIYIYIYIELFELFITLYICWSWQKFFSVSPLKTFIFIGKIAFFDKCPLKLMQKVLLYPLKSSIF